MSFNQQIAKFCSGTRTKLHAMRRGVIIKLFSAVIMDSPVLTGRLRANWNLAEGEPNLATDESLDPTGTASIAEIQAGVLMTNGSKPVFLSNSLPYAYRIEFEGWSHTKAPEGMVRKNVTRFNSLMKVEASR